MMRPPAPGDAWTGDCLGVMTGQRTASRPVTSSKIPPSALSAGAGEGFAPTLLQELVFLAPGRTAISAQQSGCGRQVYVLTQCAAILALFCIYVDAP